MPKHKLISKKKNINLYLITKANAESKQDSTKDQHVYVNSSSSEADTDQEEDGSQLHCGFTSELRARGRSEEASH